MKSDYANVQLLAQNCQKPASTSIATLHCNIRHKKESGGDDTSRLELIEVAKAGLIFTASIYYSEVKYHEIFWIKNDSLIMTVQA